MKLIVIGLGNWACALANVAIENDYDVLAWGRSQRVVDDINNQHQNSKYNITTPLNFKATSSFVNILSHSQTVLLGLPIKAMREVLLNLKKQNLQPQLFISVSKGFELNTGYTGSQIIHDIFPKVDVVVLTGPSHAESLLLKASTAVMIVGPKKQLVKTVMDIFKTDYFRLYPADDVFGSELFAAAKNVYALGAGALDGVGAKDNTKAAYITRAIYELQLLGKALGAQPETIFSLAGLGDLLVTAYSSNSRNWTYGNWFVTGKNKPQSTVEGLNTIKTLVAKAQKLNIRMPIAFAIKEALDKNLKVNDIIKQLMAQNQPEH